MDVKTCLIDFQTSGQQNQVRSHGMSNPALATMCFFIFIRGIPGIFGTQFIKKNTSPTPSTLSRGHRDVGVLILMPNT